VIVACALLFVPFLGEKREVVASTPATLPLFEPPGLVGLGEENVACIEPLTLGPDTEIARLTVGTYGRPGPPLRATLEAPGHRSSAVVSGYADNSQVSFELDPPERESEGRLCLKNEGRVPVALLGTREQRTLARPTTTVRGDDPEEVDVAVTFLRGERESIASRLGEVLERVARYRPVPAWLLWPFALVLVAGVPAGVLWAVLSRR
jgi:hypothetical protein